MNIHEYQAKELLAKFGIAIPAGYAAMTVAEAVAAAEVSGATARNNLQPIRGRMSLLNPEQAILPGIRAVASS